MPEALKNLATKSQVEAAIDLGDKIREKIKKLQTSDLSYFIGKNYFDDDGSQNYLLFQAIFKFLKIFIGTIYKIFGWKTKGLSEESIAPESKLLLHYTIDLLQNLHKFMIQKKNSKI